MGRIVDVVVDSGGGKSGCVSWVGFAPPSEGFGTVHDGPFTSSRRLWSLPALWPYSMTIEVRTFSVPSRQKNSSKWIVNPNRVQPDPILWFVPETLYPPDVISEICIYPSKFFVLFPSHSQPHWRYSGS